MNEGEMYMKNDKRWSHDKKDFLLYPDDEMSELETYIDGAYQPCRAGCLVFRRKGDIFLPQKVGIEETNVITLFDRRELISLLDEGMVAIEIVLRDSEDIIVTHCHQTPKQKISGV